MKYVRPKKIPPVVFDNPEDLLFAMIRGRHLELNGCEYSFSKELSSFMYLYNRGVFPEGIIGNREVVTNISRVCGILVGKKLKDVDPIFIAIDTLLEVGDTSKPMDRKRYFSHWDEGRVNTFKFGATSITNDGTDEWSHWEFAEQEDK